MNNVVFADFGIEIVERSGKLYIVVDSGRIAGRMEEIEITKEEAAKAQKSEQDAYEVLIARQKQKAT